MIRSFKFIKNFIIYIYISICLLVLGLILSPNTLYSNTKSKNNTNNLDFISLNFINKDWINQSTPYSSCPGYYMPEKVPNIADKNISADEITLDKNGESSLNNIIYQDKDQIIRANKALVYRDNNLNKVSKLKLQNNIEYITPDIRAVTNSANADLINNIADINSKVYFRYYSNHGRGEAKSAKFIKNKSYSVYNAYYTTCEPVTEIITYSKTKLHKTSQTSKTPWQIYTSNLTIDPNTNIGVAKNTTVYFYDVPIFYTPYLSFSTSKERKSGFLSPSYDQSNRYGYSVAIPYYLNLAPNYDATVTTRYMSQRNFLFSLEARYLDSYGKSQIDLSVLPDDPKFKTFKKNNINNPPSGLTTNNPKITNLKHASSERFSVKITDQKQWTENISTSIDYNYLSDNQYYIDIPQSKLLRRENSDHLLQQAKINYFNNNWQAEGLVKSYQELHTIDGPNITESYRVMPGFSVTNNNINLYNFNNIINLKSSIQAHAYRFALPNNPSPTRNNEGQRYYAKPAISLNIKKSYGYIIPKVAIASWQYDLNQRNAIDNTLGYSKHPSFAVPIYSLDTGLFFDRLFKYNNNNYNQTLEPRLFYLYVPYKKQQQAPTFDLNTNTISYDQLFKDNIFSGFDKQSNANQITAGLTSRLQNYNTGFEIAKLQFGQSFYLDKLKTAICDNKIPGNANCLSTDYPEYISKYNSKQSPLISLLNYNFNTKWYGQAEWQWDYDLKQTKKTNLGLHYISNISNNNNLKNLPQTIFNLEYNYLKEGNVQKDINGNRLFKTNSSQNDLFEIETSFKLPIHNYWNILGFSSYDIRNKTLLNNYFGVEFQQCCWAVRFGYKNELRTRVNSFAKKKYDNMYAIQFSLKGLWEIGSSFEDILKSNIAGYQNNLKTIY